MSEKDRCVALYRAILVFYPRTAESQHHGMKPRALISVGVIAGIRILWLAFLTNPQFFLEHVRKKVVIDLLCLCLAITSLVFSAIVIVECDPNRRLPFTSAVVRNVKNGAFDWDEQLLLHLSGL